MGVRSRAPAILAAMVVSLAAAGVSLAGSVTARVVAAPSAAAPPPQDPLSIYVMTFGPGDHPFFKFGHDAIWVHDAAAGTDQVYNFGTFIFDSPCFRS